MAFGRTPLRPYNRLFLRQGAFHAFARIVRKRVRRSCVPIDFTGAFSEKQQLILVSLTPFTNMHMEPNQDALTQGGPAIHGIRHRPDGLFAVRQPASKRENVPHLEFLQHNLQGKSYNGAVPYRNLKNP